MILSAACVLAVCVTAEKISSLSRWNPSIGDSWQWVLDAPDSGVNYSVPALVWDVDVSAGTEASEVHAARNGNGKLICYVNVGSLEDGNTRPDSSQFSSADVGNKMPGWNESYVNIRSQAVRKIMLNRFMAMKTKTCDAIEPDNTDSYLGDTGFNPPLTATDAADYLQWISESVHSLGMSVALKNNFHLISANASVVNWFDFAVVEECVARGNCDVYKPFIDQNKPVFATDYTDPGTARGCIAITTQSPPISVNSACETLNQHNFEGIIKSCDLQNEYTACQSYNLDTGIRGAPALSKSFALAYSVSILSVFWISACI